MGKNGWEPLFSIILSMHLVHMMFYRDTEYKGYLGISKDEPITY